MSADLRQANAVALLKQTPSKILAMLQAMPVTMLWHLLHNHNQKRKIPNLSVRALKRRSIIGSGFSTKA